jgi:hypothetical protein
MAIAIPPKVCFRIGKGTKYHLRKASEPRYVESVCGFWLKDPEWVSVDRVQAEDFCLKCSGALRWRDED